MATVRFSGELIDSIKSNAHSTFDLRMKKAAEIDEAIADRIYDHAFKDYYAKMSALPREFFEQYDAFVIQSFGTVTPHVQVRFSSSRPLPKAYPPNFKLAAGWNSSNVRYNVDSNDPVDVELERYFIEREQNIKAVVEQRNKFVEGVLQVCGSFTTLAPALKAWPPLWDLIPQATKNRHLEVTERKSAADKKDALNEINLGSLTATVVASKLVR